jgi:hypothetical protein
MKFKSFPSIFSFRKRLMLVQLFRESVDTANIFASTTCKVLRKVDSHYIIVRKASTDLEHMNSYKDNTVIRFKISSPSFFSATAN